MKKAMKPPRKRIQPLKKSASRGRKVFVVVAILMLLGSAALFFRQDEQLESVDIARISPQHSSIFQQLTPSQK